MKIIFKNIEPEIEVDDQKDDSLGYSEFSSLLVRLIKTAQPPFTIAIDGEWGSGKSSILNFVKNKLREENVCEIIDFDAWLYKNEIPLALPLLSSIKDIAPPDKENEIKSTVIGFYEAFKTVGEQTVKNVIGVDFGEVQLRAEKRKSLNNRWEDYERYINKLKKWKIDFETLINKLTTADKNKIVIFVDNIDRCLPDNIVGFLEDISIFFKSKSVVFVLAMDRKIIKAAFSSRYGDEVSFSSNKYLEKIIDISLTLPYVKKENIEDFLNKRFLEQITNLNENEKKILKDQISYLGQVAANNTMTFVNPRRFARVLKRLMVCFSIFELEPKDFSETFMALYIKEIYPDYFEDFINLSTKEVSPFFSMLDRKKVGESPDEAYETRMKTGGTALVQMRNNEEFINLMMALIDVAKAVQKEKASELTGGSLINRIFGIFRTVDKIN